MDINSSYGQSLLQATVPSLSCNLLLPPVINCRNDSFSFGFPSNSSTYVSVSMTRSYWTLTGNIQQSDAFPRRIVLHSNLSIPTLGTNSLPGYQIMDTVADLSGSVCLR